MPIIKGSLGNGKERAVRVDKLTNALITVTYAHHETHDGQHFNISHSDQLASTGDKAQIALQMPGWTPTVHDDFDTTYHLIFDWWASQPMSFGIYEDCTTISGGTATVPGCTNRQNPQTTLITAVRGSLTRTGGTLLQSLTYAGVRSEAGLVKREEELILKPSSQYCFELTQLANGANNCGISLSYYQTRPKD